MSNPISRLSRAFGRKAKRDAAPKYVVAHHMIGNTYPYTTQDWTDDIALASASGIDGFALNMGSDAWQPDRVSDAFNAASQSGPNFKLFLSLDMTSLPCASASDAQALRALVLQFISHPNYLQINGLPMVSTFAGETCAFGQASPPDGWNTQFVGNPDLQGKIHFVPSFFVDPSTFATFSHVMDGDFNWNSAWPIQITTAFVQNLVSGLPSFKAAGNALSTVLTQDAVQNALGPLIGSSDPDNQHVKDLSALSSTPARRDTSSKPTYMASVSPWFFTHYGADSFNKNFIYFSDEHLYAKRWESLIQNRDQVDIVQVLTWNDYGESHYIGPIKGAQPNSQGWVDGLEHTGWLDLTSYYAAAFKTGTFPTIAKDKLVMWSRTHPTLATAPDPVGPPTNYELVSLTYHLSARTT
ncbi:hypothetical protein H0H93_006145 [Arthromyces matolae]|nr:hypothetical protein H0H93_006145 [Arthromyces matolae]